MTNPQAMKTAAAAAYIGKSVSWLTKARMRGTGPVYMKLGGGVLYDANDLDAWMQAGRRTAIYDFNNDPARASASM